MSPVPSPAGSSSPSPASGRSSARKPATAGNAAAVALYEHLGFVRYGTEPHALRVNGRDFDEHLMVLRFP